MSRVQGGGIRAPASLRRGNLTVKFLRAVARLPEGHGLLWRILIPSSPRRLRHIVCDSYGFCLHLDLTQLLDFEYAVGICDRMELDFLLAAVEDQSYFIDIGANQGFYSLWLAWRKPALRVLAFEPDGYSLDKLSHNVAASRLDNITICPHALSDKEEIRALVIAQNRNRGASSLLRGRANGAGSGEALDVPCRTLLQALREHGVERISALKIDAEGYEFPILKKFFEEAPASLYPKALVVEGPGDSVAAVGGCALEILFTRGYRIVNHNRFNFLMELKEPRTA